MKTLAHNLKFGKKMFAKKIRLTLLICLEYLSLRQRKIHSNPGSPTPFSEKR